MVWSTVHDEMLCREILVVDPFTRTKKRVQWKEELSGKRSPKT